MKNIISLFTLFLLLTSCSDIERTKDRIEERAQVYNEDAFYSLSVARNLNLEILNYMRGHLLRLYFQKWLKVG